MGEKLENKLPERINVDFFKCIADDCPGEGYFIVQTEEDGEIIRNGPECEECFHSLYLEGEPIEYILDPKYKNNSG